MNISYFSCHREFLDNYIKLHKHSMKSFESAIDSIVSSSTISRVVKKDRNNQYVKAFNIGLDSWVDLISKLKLNPNQKLQAILLRAKDSISSSSGADLSTCNNILQDLSTKLISDEFSEGTLSMEAQQVADTYDKFPIQLKKILAKDLLKTIQVYKVLDPPKGETLTNNYNYLEKMVN